MPNILIVGPKFTRPASRIGLNVQSTMRVAGARSAPLLHSFAAAGRAALGTDIRRTDGRTRHRFNTLTAYAVSVKTIYISANAPTAW